MVVLKRVKICLYTANGLSLSNVVKYGPRVAIIPQYLF